MKTLKNLFFTLLLVSLFPSCKHYRVVEFTSASSNLSSETFTQENDTFAIKYSFWGQDGIFSFSFTNKLNIPLYLDLKKSLFYVNEVGTEYSSDETSHTGKNFIPPHASYFSTTFSLKPYNRKGNYAFRDTLLPDRSTMGVVTFNVNSTPVFIRSFLTFSTKENSDNAIYIDHYFYVSKIFNIRPRLLEYVHGKESRYWYEVKGKNPFRH